MDKEELKNSEDSFIDINFDEIVEDAKNLKAEDGLRLIWNKAFSLPEWFFIPFGENNLPFMGTVDDKSWVFAFTDIKHAQDFAFEMGIIDGAVDAHVVTIDTKEVIDFLDNFNESGVHGIRFNEGTHGWYTTLTNIRAIRDFVME
jgi:hypothetical protein